MYNPNFTFGSEHANMEYTILSAILGNHSPSEPQTSPASPVDQPSYSSWSIDYPTNYVPSFNESTISVQLPDSPLSTSPPNSAHYLAYPYTSQPTKADDVPDHIHFTPLREPQLQGQLSPLSSRYPRPRSPIPTSFLEDPGLPNIHGKGPALVVADLDRARSCRSPLQNIHERVTAPYDYTEGYHFLMKHLPTRYVFCVETSVFTPRSDRRFPFLILGCRN